VHLTCTPYGQLAVPLQLQGPQPKDSGLEYTIEVGTGVLTGVDTGTEDGFEEGSAKRLPIVTVSFLVQTLFLHSYPAIQFWLLQEAPAGFKVEVGVLLVAPVEVGHDAGGVHLICDPYGQLATPLQLHEPQPKDTGSEYTVSVGVGVLTVTVGVEVIAEGIFSGYSGTCALFLMSNLRLLLLIA